MRPFPAGAVTMLGSWLVKTNWLMDMGALITLIVCFLSVFPITATAPDGEEHIRIISASNYPNQRIGPSSWEYFRVELPAGFSSLYMTFTKNWSSGKRATVCFRFGGPPLPSPAVDTMESALFMAGRIQNSSSFGQCAWFYETESIKVTNKQVISGLLYVGVFSDPKATRTQSQMISRGPIYSFSLQFILFGCAKPSLGGPYCNITITTLFSLSPLSSMTSSIPLIPDMANGKMDTSVEFQKLESNVNGQQNATSNTFTEIYWSNMSRQCLVEEDSKYFLLHIPSFSPMIEIIINDEPISSFNASKEPAEYQKLQDDEHMQYYVRYGALPYDTYDYAMDVGTSTLTIYDPRHGDWYIGISSGNAQPRNSCFSLYWRIHNCKSGVGGRNCSWPVVTLERILSNTRESPFDSFYGPPERNNTSKSEWFPWYLPTSTADVRWIYFVFEVPRGASGSVISIELTSLHFKNIEVYGSFQACPTLQKWDFCKSSEEADNNSDGRIHMDLIYPIEGIWCIGLMYSKNLTHSFLDQPVEAVSLVPKVVQLVTDTKQTFSTGHSVERNIETMMISLHGCPKSCRGYGNCDLQYEASRLTLYSYCQCDRTHGGYDCAEEMVSARVARLHIWFLIASNAAAILPSIWSLHHRAFSEWLIYTSSGVSSAVYHSCDAGGWCALPYDTLQFLDFWLSFLAVIFTCLYVAEFIGGTKATLHVGATILTAIVASKNRTSTRSVLVVVMLGVLALVCGLGLEYARQKQIQRWRSLWQKKAMLCSLLVYALARHVKLAVRRILQRFRWTFVALGITSLGLAWLSFFFENAKTYWIWHSIWHLGMYTSAFFLLCSTSGNTENHKLLESQVDDSSEIRPEAAINVNIENDAGLVEIFIADEDHDAMELENFIDG